MNSADGYKFMSRGCVSEWTWRPTLYWTLGGFLIDLSGRCSFFRRLPFNRLRLKIWWRRVHVLTYLLAGNTYWFATWYGGTFWLLFWEIYLGFCRATVRNLRARTVADFVIREHQKLPQCFGWPRPARPKMEFRVHANLSVHFIASSSPVDVNANVHCSII